MAGPCCLPQASTAVTVAGGTQNSLSPGGDRAWQLPMARPPHIRSPPRPPGAAQAGLPLSPSSGTLPQHRPCRRAKTEPSLASLIKLPSTEGNQFASKFPSARQVALRALQPGARRDSRDGTPSPGGPHTAPRCPGPAPTTRAGTANASPPPLLHQRKSRDHVNEIIHPEITHAELITQHRSGSEPGSLGAERGAVGGKPAHRGEMGRGSLCPLCRGAVGPDGLFRNVVQSPGAQRCSEQVFHPGRAQGGGPMPRPCSVGAAVRGSSVALSCCARGEALSGLLSQLSTQL